jgi:hypothetical protein
MKKILLSCVTVLLCVSAIAQNSAILKLNLEKNKVYRLNTVAEQTIIQTINGNQQTVESKINRTASIKMIDATADFLIAEVRFDTLISNTNSMGKTSNISSVSEGNIKSTEVADVMSSIMNRLTKNALYVKMDFTGHVVQVVNAKMLSDVVLSDTSSITLANPVGAAIKGQIKNMVTENALISMVEMFTHYLPAKEIATGDNWSITAKSTSGGMSLDVITNYHLESIKGNIASITADSEIKASANAAPMMSGPAKITYDDLKGLSKSTILMDIRTGLVIEDKAKSHTAGNLGISAPGMSMQMPMDINATSKVISLE